MIPVEMDVRAQGLGGSGRRSGSWEGVMACLPIVAEPRLGFPAELDIRARPLVNPRSKLLESQQNNPLDDRINKMSGGVKQYFCARR